MFAKILSHSMARACHHGGETKSAERCVLSRASPLCRETREQRVATAWWGGWTGAAARRWAGEDPGKGVLGVSSTPEGTLTPPHLLHTQSPFVLRS